MGVWCVGSQNGNGGSSCRQKSYKRDSLSLFVIEYKIGNRYCCGRFPESKIAKEAPNVTYIIHSMERREKSNCSVAVAHTYVELGCIWEVTIIL